MMAPSQRTGRIEHIVNNRGKQGVHRNFFKTAAAPCRSALGVATTLVLSSRCDIHSFTAVREGKPIFAKPEGELLTYGFTDSES